MIEQPCAPPTESGNYACLTWIGWRILVWVSTPETRGWYFPEATAVHAPAVVKWVGPLTPARLPSYAPKTTAPLEFDL
jgi:hypothetical protein